MLTQDTDKKLFLLDAYALIYRSYFAFSKNPRINSKGLNTSAVFGFMNSLLEILNNEKPSHIAVVFDPPGPVHRSESFAAYKANRDETPEDIKLSVPIIHSLLRAMNIKEVTIESYEADDTIGTLAKMAEKEGFLVYMMTPDKDYAQLVSENIFMYKPARMGNAAEIWGIPEVQKKFEVEHVEQVIDILGMWGDAVDNIPGIPGIGEKTAKKFIKLYGSMEGLYDHTHELKGKQKEKVEDNKKQAFLSKMLATIITDVPVEFNEVEYKKEDPDASLLRPLLEELEFRRMEQRILGQVASTEESQLSMFKQTQVVEEASLPVEEKKVNNIENSSHEYILVDTADKRAKLIRELEKTVEFCFDTETSSVDFLTASLAGLAFSYQETKGYYVPVPEEFEEAKKIVQEFASLLTDTKKIKVAHNLKYDFHILLRYGVEVAPPLFDTMVAHFILHPDANRRKMGILTEQYLNYQEIDIESLIGKGKNQITMQEAPLDKVVNYAAEDADLTLRLKSIFNQDLIKNEDLEIFEKIDMPLLPVLAQMEKEGINLNVAHLENYSTQLSEEIETIKQKIFNSAGEEFKINSPKEVGRVLFDILKVTNKPKKTKSGQYATNEEVLQKLIGKHPVIEQILEYREVVKLQNTYVDPLPKLINPDTKKIHTSFNQVVAATGRLSSDKPNLQNIPIRTDKGREIRKAFIAKDENHLLLAADYSQIELRIIAALSKDDGMLDAFRNGQDIHASTASKVYNVPLEEVTREMRSNAKTVNFGIIYGISAFGLSQRIGISRTEAKSIIDNYFEKFPQIKTYMDESIAYARKHGYVKTVMGRKRYLRDINSANAVVRGYAERNAINSPIQGSAADLIKIAMINIQKRFEQERFKSKMILQVHDELVFDAHVDEISTIQPIIEQIMSDALDLGVPLVVDSQTGQNWLQAH